MDNGSHWYMELEFPSLSAQKRTRIEKADEKFVE